jgi:hypothetical protein
VPDEDELDTSVFDSSVLEIGVAVSVLDNSDRLLETSVLEASELVIELESEGDEEIMLEDGEESLIDASVLKLDDSLEDDVVLEMSLIDNKDETSELDDILEYSELGEDASPDDSLEVSGRDELLEIDEILELSSTEEEIELGPSDEKELVISDVAGTFENSELEKEIVFDWVSVLEPSEVAIGTELELSTVDERLAFDEIVVYSELESGISVDDDETSYVDIASELEGVLETSELG